MVTGAVLEYRIPNLDTRDALSASAAARIWPGRIGSVRSDIFVDLKLLQ